MSDDEATDENGDPAHAPDLFKWLSREVREFMPARVPVLNTPPTALQFSRDYVAANRPCVVKHAVDHWPARHLWNTKYLSAKLGDTPISVNVTPTGFGDALHATKGIHVKTTHKDTGGTLHEEKSPPPLVFVQPEQRQMRFAEFCELLRQSKHEQAIRESAVLVQNQQSSPQSPPLTAAAAALLEKTQKQSLTRVIPYVSRQNDSFASEFAEKLRADLGNDSVKGLPWASEAFGTPPDAVNLWCGSQNAVTTFHRDHYENVYVVISGQKTFTLLPPCDAWRLANKKAPSARFRYGQRGGSSGIMDETIAGTDTSKAAAAATACIVLDTPITEITWSSATPQTLKSDGGPPPFVVTVHAGETLYLPALWFHYVEQSDCIVTHEPTVAINFWHDMRFGDRFATARFLEAGHQRFGRAS